MIHYIVRHEDSNSTFAIALRDDGAMLYPQGAGFGIFMKGQFGADDLNKIVELHLAQIQAINLAFENMERESIPRKLHKGH